MELEKGVEYVMTSRSGGVMTVEVAEFVRDGSVALLRPTDPAVRAWFNQGYTLGRAHWDSMLKPIRYERST